MHEHAGSTWIQHSGSSYTPTRGYIQPMVPFLSITYFFSNVAKCLEFRVEVIQITIEYIGNLFSGLKPLWECIIVFLYV